MGHVLHLNNTHHLLHGDPDHNPHAPMFQETRRRCYVPHHTRLHHTSCGLFASTTAAASTHFSTHTRRHVIYLCTASNTPALSSQLQFTKKSRPTAFYHCTAQAHSNRNSTLRSPVQRVTWHRRHQPAPTGRTWPAWFSRNRCCLPQSRRGCSLATGRLRARLGGTSPAETVVSGGWYVAYSIAPGSAFCGQA